MASKTGLVAQRDSPIYCATKGAAIQLARVLALDWASEEHRAANAVCPGIVDTPMLESFFEQLPDPERSRREFATAQPLGRLARPAECAAAALFWPPSRRRSSPVSRCRSTAGSPLDEVRRPLAPGTRALVRWGHDALVRWGHEGTIDAIPGSSVRL